MRFIAPRHIDDTQITVTNTATALFSLMATAASVSPSTISDYYIPNGNAVWLYCATNSFRFAFGTPTAAKGALVQTGERRLVMGDLSTLKLIRTGGSNATVDVEIGRASEFESVFGMANTASVTVTADTEFSAASAASDAYANPTSTTDVKSLSHSFNGTTWDRTRSAVITPSATLTGIQNSLPWAMYNASPTARTEGQGGPLQANADGSLQVGGNVASAATDSGNPVKVGGKYNATPPTFTDGQRGDLQLSSRGSVRTNIIDGNGITGASVGGSTDGSASSITALHVVAHNKIYNGSTLDRQRSVVDAANTTGTGIAAAGLMAQFDDTSPTVITENQFGNLRMSANRYLYTEQHYLSGQATADTQIAAASGFVHTVTISPLTATPTAGLLTVYDSLTETGTVLYSEWIFATTVGHTVTLDIPASTGIYVGFDGTLANVRCVVSYRLNT